MIAPDLSSLTADDRAAIASMPKIELHVHLEGSIRPPAMLTLAERNGVDLGVDDEDALRATYDFDDFDQFANLFMLGLSVLRTAQDFEHITEQLALELIEQNVLHAEITVTPWNHLNRGVPIEEFVAGLDAGRRVAAQLGLSILWIHDIPRGFEFAPYELTMDYMLGHRVAEGAVAIGLGGTEVGYPAQQFVEPFERAIAAGYRSAPHAGETEGAPAVRDAIDLLGAERIGHGVRAVEDPELVAELAERQLPLEVSPTSNIALKVVPDFGAHQLREMLSAGLNVSVNSDDPAYFSTTLTRELEIAAAYAGCGVGDLRAMQLRAIEDSFLDEAGKTALRERFSRA